MTDPKELQKQIQNLKERNEELSRQLAGLDILKEDRKVLVKQVEEANEKVEALMAENQSLRLQNEELNTKLKGLSQSTASSEAPSSQSRALNVSGDDKKFQEAFHLPSTEFEIASYRGSYERKRDTGKIHVTPHYVVFRKNTLFSSTDDVKIPFVDVVKIEKPPKHEHSVILTTKDGKEHLFRAILGRDGLIDEMNKQHARTMGFKNKSTTMERERTL